MLRIYNSNFRTNKQRLIAAIAIGGIAAVLSAANLAFLFYKNKFLKNKIDISNSYKV